MPVFLTLAVAMTAVSQPASIPCRIQPAPVLDRNAGSEEVKRAFLAGNSVWNARDLDRLLAAAHPDLALLTPTGWIRGRAAVRDHLSVLFQAFPHIRTEVEQVETRLAAPGWPR